MNGRNALTAVPAIAMKKNDRRVVGASMRGTGILADAELGHVTVEVNGGRSLFIGMTTSFTLLPRLRGPALTSFRSEDLGWLGGAFNIEHFAKGAEKSLLPLRIASAALQSSGHQTTVRECSDYDNKTQSSDDLLLPTPSPSRSR